MAIKMPKRGNIVNGGDGEDGEDAGKAAKVESESNKTLFFLGGTLHRVKEEKSEKAKWSRRPKTGFCCYGFGVNSSHSSFSFVGLCYFLTYNISIH